MIISYRMSVCIECINPYNLIIRSYNYDYINYNYSIIIIQSFCIIALVHDHHFTEASVFYQ
jgi:hypothetical protein